MNKKFSIKNSYKKFYKGKKEIIYPAEGVIRIFKGNFPKLLKFKKTKNQTLAMVWKTLSFLKNRLRSMGYGNI